MEDFVTFNIAKKLKDKGFDWETSNVYERNTIACIYEDYPKPTISQVLKWLRKEKKIHICIDFDGDMKWYYQIAIYCSTDIAADGYGYDDYEISALAGIECVLNNFI